MFSSPSLSPSTKQRTVNISRWPQNKRSQYLRRNVACQTIKLQRVGTSCCKHVVFSFIVLWNLRLMFGIMLELMQHSTLAALWSTTQLLVKAFMKIFAPTENNRLDYVSFITLCNKFDKGKRNWQGYRYFPASLNSAKPSITPLTAELLLERATILDPFPAPLVMFPN